LRIPVGRGSIALVQGDITRQRADVLVTAANAGLRGGGGVDGAIHRAAGPELLEACRVLGGCPTGSAVATEPFGLRENGARLVIHAVGPRWRDGRSGEADLLRSAYGRSLELAEEAGCSSIAFPSISTGVYGYPVADAAALAVETVHDHLAAPGDALEEVIFVLFDAGTYEEFQRAVDERCAGGTR
jgi:O-acetyl-ADP-ribose deacetylase